MPYEYLDSVATADVAFRAWGEDVEQTFIEAGKAVMNVMVEELETIDGREQRRVHLENGQLDMLLFDFLESIIYYKDAENLLLRPSRVEIKSDSNPGRPDGRFALDGILVGEAIDPARHRLSGDVKAVTLHQFKLEKTSAGWEAFVVLDV